MKKIVSLFIVLSLLLSINIVYAENKDISSTVKYDIDDFSAYLVKHNDGKNTKALIEDYFKDKTNDDKNCDIKANSEDFSETKIINGKKLKTSKVIKTVEISDTQSITFYANGYFGIGEKIVKEPDESLEVNILSSYYTEWAQYQYDAYNGAGVWMGATLVGQSFAFDGEFVGIDSEPTGSYSYNQVLYSLVSHDVWSTAEVGQIIYGYATSYSEEIIKPRVSSDNYVIFAAVQASADGNWYGDGDVGIIEWWGISWLIAKKLQGAVSKVPK